MTLKSFFRPHSYLKLIRILFSPFVKLKNTPNPSLYMTLLVRNEEDILELNLNFHKAMGVDGFIVTDNNSTDSTPEILKKYKDKGWIKEIIKEEDLNYEQAKWVDRMIKLVRDKYHADWVINSDADELWCSSCRNLKKELACTRTNIINCQLKNVVPQENVPIPRWNDIVEVQLVNPEKWNLSKYSVYNIQYPKVIHRTKGYKMIAPGNHSVEMFPIKQSTSSDVVIYHYPVRSYMHFTRKAKQGGEVMLLNPNKSLNGHFQALYQIYLKGELLNEYHRVVGYNILDALKKEGIVKNDDTISIISKSFDF